MKCPNCGSLNDPSNRFCMSCGTRLNVNASSTPEKSSKHTPSLAPHLKPSPLTQPVVESTPTPVSADKPSKPFGTGTRSPLSIWGPFAGYGARRRHVGWLLNGEGASAQALIGKVEEKFDARQIPGSRLEKRTLVARGAAVERRPYFILRRGLASLMLYVSQFGNDLFISQASYLKPPVSFVRVLIVIGMLLFQIYVLFYYPSALSAALQDLFAGLNPLGGASANSGPSLFLLCCLGMLSVPNLLALSLLVIFSAYRWLTDRDPLAPLRVPPNEFNEDDLMAMEKAVEETVRQSMTELKLNPDDLKLATVERGGQLF